MSDAPQFAPVSRRLATLVSVHVFMLWRRGYEARQAATQPT